MDAKIITIGDEILIGQIIDTNSAWIAARLNDAGVHVTGCATVGDEPQAIAAAVEEALANANVVITTGGLGPTKDDRTKQVLAAMFGCGMVEDAATHARNERMLAARGIAYNELNRAQAMIPECCEPLPNPHGTAPGMWFERGGEVLVALPGVPFEMKYLLDEEVVPRLRNHFSISEITHKTMTTFGIAESMLAETIAAWETALPSYLHLAYLPGPSGIRLRLSTYGEVGTGAQEEVGRQFAKLEKIIPDYVVGYDGETVSSAVAKMLTARGQTLAVAESCTGGALSARFTALSGASEYFLGGVVAYDNAVKTHVLGVDSATIEQHGAVSREVAEQMAAGVLRLTGSDYAISTTGIAGPAGGTPEKPVGTVWIAVAHNDGVHSRLLTLGKLRDQNIERASAAAANLSRLILIGHPDTPMRVGTL